MLARWQAWWLHYQNRRSGKMREYKRMETDAQQYLKVWFCRISFTRTHESSWQVTDKQNVSDDPRTMWGKHANEPDRKNSCSRLNYFRCSASIHYTSCTSMETLLNSFVSHKNGKKNGKKERQGRCMKICGTHAWKTATLCKRIRTPGGLVCHCPRSTEDVANASLYIHCNYCHSLLKYFTCSALSFYTLCSVWRMVLYTVPALPMLPSGYTFQWPDHTTAAATQALVGILWLMFDTGRTIARWHCHTKTLRNLSI